MKYHNYLNVNFVAAVLLVSLVVGCAKTLTVSGKYPKPIIRQMPYSLAVVYDDAFTQYQYIEQSEDRDEWQIKIGSAQAQLFATILPAMFKRVQNIPSIKSNGSPLSVDLLMYPALIDFQYNVPKETNVEMFEVWMKYNVKVYEPDGELIADWILTAYGKTPSEMMQSKESALNDAMNVALRDAGANLALSFRNVPEIRAWIKHKERSKL